jgi:hypothetical protein
MASDNTSFANRTLFEFSVVAMVIAWNFNNWFLPLGLAALLIIVVKSHLVYSLKGYIGQTWDLILHRVRRELIGEMFMSVVFMYLAFAFGLLTKYLFELAVHYFE